MCVVECRSYRATIHAPGFRQEWFIAQRYYNVILENDNSRFTNSTGHSKK